MTNNGVGFFGILAIKLKNAANSIINPATEDKQDDIITNQTDGTQKTQIVDSGDSAEEVDVVTATDSTTNLDGLSGLVSNSIISGRVDDTSVKAIKVDGATHSICIINYEHCEVHSGSHYDVRVNKDISNGGTFNLAFTTPNTTKWVHMVFGVETELEADVILYEDITSFSGGSAQTPINSNRNSGNTSGIVDMELDTTPVLGTPVTLGHAVLGSGKSTGGGARAAEEFVLKQNTKYYFLITNQATGASNETNINLTWYEHTNKS